MSIYSGQNKQVPDAQKRGVRQAAAGRMVGKGKSAENLFFQSVDNLL
jgi:hypothetical protein